MHTHPTLPPYPLHSQALHVFTADFTVPDDKASLVDSSIALYFILMRKHREASLSDTGLALLAYITQNSSGLFPAAYFEDMVQIAEDLAYHDTVRLSDPHLPPHPPSSSPSPHCLPLFSFFV
jgi:hypothetical protein